MEKEVYESPKLTKVGTVKDLTLGGHDMAYDDLGTGSIEAPK